MGFLISLIKCPLWCFFCQEIWVFLCKSFRIGLSKLRNFGKNLLHFSKFVALTVSVIFKVTDNGIHHFSNSVCDVFRNFSLLSPIGNAAYYFSKRNMQVLIH